LLPWQQYEITVAAVAIKRSELIGNDIEIMLLNSPVGSTLHWGARRALLCLAPVVCIVFQFNLDGQTFGYSTVSSQTQ